ncbi:MAG: DUF2849 domain-containing protein [Gammaproteobacteria bacterium]|nr:DUF2849 domain-containing protein [Gammaproteobacteria bacterium]
MAQSEVQQVLTGNDLQTGEVIFYTQMGTFTEDLTKALVFDDDSEASAALKRIIDGAGDVVGAYLIEVQSGSKGVQASHIRERIRTAGPTNYFHGKQEEVR